MTVLSLLPPMLLWHLLTWVRPLLVNLLLWFLLVRPLRPTRPWKTLLALLLVLDAAQAPILRFLGGSPFMPDIPGPILVALHLLRGLATLTFLELLILWPILVIVRLISRHPGRLPRTGGTGAPPVHPRMENDCVAPSPSSSCARTGGGARPPSTGSTPENRLLKPRLVLALLLANAALLATAFTSALLPPRVTVLEVPIPGLPPALDGYRILHITDIHADPINGAWRTHAIVRRANAAAPDLVCITGDFADGSCARLAPALAPLAALRAPDGIYACTGNHEYYPPSVNSGWPAYFASLGIHFPDAAPALIHRANTLLAVASLPDNAPPGAPLPPLPGDINLYLKHRPVDLAPLAAARAHLILSGHTHGGQFPPLTHLVAAANEGHLSGLYPIPPRTLLHVSPGASQWNGLPYRFLRPPTLPLLVLRPASP